MAEVIAIVNQKGGVGKTTTTINLGIGLAAMGKRVLLIDGDPQGSLTDCMGFPEPDEMEITLGNAMVNVMNEEEMPLDYGILFHEEGVEVMPANIDLSGIEVTLVNTICRELVLKNYIDKLRPQYDYILIDGMTALGLLTINALAAADAVIIPIQAAKASLRGLQQLIRTIGKVRKQVNPKLKIMGILPSMVDERTNYEKGIVNLLKASYGEQLKIFDTIPRSVRLAETGAEGKSIYKHDPKGKTAEAYLKLVGEVLTYEKC